MHTESMKELLEQDISKQIWHDSYQWETDANPYDTFRRIAKAISSVEKPEAQKEWEEKYYDLLSNLRYIPGGRIISNAGTRLKNTTLINCFVSGFQGKHQDSMEGITTEKSRMAKILASEGGYGCNFDAVRPRGAYIKGIGVETPGAVKWMESWDTDSGVITAGSGGKALNKGKNKIRKGAMMGTLSIWNPGIEEFITAKQQPGRLSRFNLSVLITDEFMSAVDEHKPWNLEYPDTEFDKYDDEWDGDLGAWKAKNYPTKIWYTYEDANILWELIMKSTYNRNEPGVIFVDRYNELNNLRYMEKIRCTNPCGEQGLPVNGSCNLGSINLTQYVRSDRKGYDFAALERDIPTIVRFQDSINDITNFPLKAQKEEAMSKRRAGIGYMGYGSSLYMIKQRYGSHKALELTEELLEHNVNHIYRASAMLAAEKGAFPAYDKEKYLKSMFIHLALNRETIDLIEKHGIRNSHLTTVAPTGNSGIFANNVSGGLEPVISATYIRSISVPVPPEGMVMPKNINWETRECENKDGWTWDSEGDEFILKTTFKGVHYKIERTRGLAAEQKVMDYAVLHMPDFDKTAKYAVGINDLSVSDHIETMKIFAKYTDSSISKTINVPADFGYDEFKNIYKDAFETGYIKGITTYRHGTMTSVLKVESDEKKDGKPHLEIRQEVSRPKTLPCNVHRISILGRNEETGEKTPEKWIVFIGLYENKPYEVFAGRITDVNIPKTVTEGQIVRVRSGHYALSIDDEVIINDISKTFDNKDHDAFTRLISSLLRNGVNVNRLVEQLSKCRGTLADMHKAIITALKKYVKDGDAAGTCPNCGAQLVFSEGCMKCLNCGASKCG